MSNPIKFDDIRVGDTVKATQVEFGVVVERTGTVAYLGKGDLRTNEHGNVFREGWAGDWSYELLDRPKQPLPTEPGTVVLAKRIDAFGSPHIHLALSWDGVWVALITGQRFLPTEIIEWSPVKMFDA